MMEPFIKEPAKFLLNHSKATPSLSHPLALDETQWRVEDETNNHLKGQNGSDNNARFGDISLVSS